MSNYVALECHAVEERETPLSHTLIPGKGGGGGGAADELEQLCGVEKQCHGVDQRDAPVFP